MLAQVRALCTSLCTVFQCTQHLRASQSRMARLLVGTCAPGLSGVYAQLHTGYTILNANYSIGGK
jgi:hypothetical protein